MMRGSGFGPALLGGPPLHGPGIFGVLLIAGLVAAVVILVVLLLQQQRRDPGAGRAVLAPPSATATDDALAIARRRFANGEVGVEEFEAMRNALTAEVSRS